MIQIRRSCYQLTSTSCSSWRWFVPEEDHDGRQTFRKIIEIESEYMGDNFAPGLLIIGGLGMVLHAFGVPLVIAYDFLSVGNPVQCKLPWPSLERFKALEVFMNVTIYFEYLVKIYFDY